MHGRHRARLFSTLLGLALLPCLVLFASAEQVAATEPAIRAGYIEFPPYSYTDENDQAAGDIVDLVNLLAQRAGHRVEFHVGPNLRVFKSLESGQVEVWATVVNHPMVGPHVLQSAYRIARLKLNLYYRGTNVPQLPYALRGSRLLLMQGFVYPNSPLTAYIEDPDYRVSKSQAPSHSAAIQMLRRGRADYLLNYQTPMEQALGETDQPLPPHVVVLEQDFTLVFSKRSPRAQLLRDDFDRALKQLKDSDQLPEKFRDLDLHGGAGDGG